jgi:predicted amidophosphoribosyltransferase
MENNIRTICGPWTSGYVLDKHTISSTYLGDDEFGHPRFDTKRSEVGEALYQLKYRHDFSKAEPLATELKTHLVPKFGPIGFVVPMPPSNARERQPVTEIARLLSEKIGAPMFDNILVKRAPAANTPQLKDIAGKDAKIAALTDRFTINPAIANDEKWNVLLVDDLFDSGASMEAAATKLKEYDKVGEIYVTALTWK